MAPRPATDPNRWRQVTGGRNIRRQPQKSTFQKAFGMLPMGRKPASAKGSRKGLVITGEMASRSLEEYRQRYRCHVDACIGRMPVQSVQAPDISAMLNKRRAKTSV